MKLAGCSAVVTGASAGIGRELARQLAPRAKRMLLVARRRDRLEELREQLLHSNPALSIEIEERDLSDLSQTKELAQSLTAKQIDFLINNAGLGDIGAFATAEPTRVLAQVQVNVLALTALSRSVLPAMLAQRRGAILNVSSSAGFMPMAGFAVYAATKAYVTSFSEAIRAETRGCGITVTALCPGPVHTEFTRVADREGKIQQLGSEIFHVPVERVARAALSAVEHDRPLIIPGLTMKVGMGISRLFPLALLRAAARVGATNLRR